MISFTIISLSLLIILFILLFIARKENTRLLTKLKEEKEKTNTSKVEAILLALILSRLSCMVRINLLPLTRNMMPVKVTELDNDVVGLQAIRFKKVNDTVLIYLNGAMVPYSGDIKLNHPNSFTNDNFKDLDLIIETLHKKQHTGSNIIENLRQINQNLNK